VNQAANWWPCILCHPTSCMELPTDRTETHAVVDSNIQAPSKVFSFSHHVPTMQCTFRLTVGGTLWILLLLLLFHCHSCMCVRVHVSAEALHLSNLMCATGYIFPIDDHILVVKNDGAYYRFQVCQTVHWFHSHVCYIWWSIKPWAMSLLLK